MPPPAFVPALLHSSTPPFPHTPRSARSCAAQLHCPAPRRSQASPAPAAVATEAGDCSPWQQASPGRRRVETTPHRSSLRRPPAVPSPALELRAIRVQRLSAVQSAPSPPAPAQTPLAAHQSRASPAHRERSPTGAASETRRCPRPPPPPHHRPPGTPAFFRPTRHGCVDQQSLTEPHPLAASSAVHPVVVPVRASASTGPPFYSASRGTPPVAAFLFCGARMRRTPPALPAAPARCRSKGTA